MNENLKNIIEDLKLDKEIEKIIKMNILKPNLKKYNNNKNVKKELEKMFNILYLEMEIINEKTYYELFNKLENLLN